MTLSVLGCLSRSVKFCFYNILSLVYLFLFCLCCATCSYVVICISSLGCLVFDPVHAWSRLCLSWSCICVSCPVRSVLSLFPLPPVTSLCCSLAFSSLVPQQCLCRSCLCLYIVGLCLCVFCSFQRHLFCVYYVQLCFPCLVSCLCSAVFPRRFLPALNPSHIFRVCISLCLALHSPSFLAVPWRSVAGESPLHWIRGCCIHCCIVLFCLEIFS